MGRQSKSIEEWLSKQGDKCAGVRIQLGSRATGTTVGIVEIEGRGLKLSDVTVPYSAPIDGAPRVIEDLALDAGWGGGMGQESTLRLYSMDVRGKSLSTYQKTAKNDTRAGAQLSDIHAISLEHRKTLDKLMDTLCEQSRIQTKSLDIMTETLAHRESLMAGILESFMDAQIESAETRATNFILETALEGGAEKEGVRSLQGQVLQQVMGLLGGPAADPGEDGEELNAEQIYQAMKSNPFLKYDLEELFNKAANEEDGKAESNPD